MIPLIKSVVDSTSLKNNNNIRSSSNINIALLLGGGPTKRQRTPDFFEETLIELKSYNLYKEISFNYNKEKEKEKEKEKPRQKTDTKTDTKKQPELPSPSVVHPDPDISLPSSSSPPPQTDPIPVPIPAIRSRTPSPPTRAPRPTKLHKPAHHSNIQDVVVDHYYHIPAHLFDHLFWLFYICKFGISHFELEVLSMNKFFAADAEQIYFNFRIETALMLRKDKKLLPYPPAYRVANIETPLSSVASQNHQKQTSTNLFVALCLIHGVNAAVFFEEKRIMVETLVSDGDGDDDNDERKIHVIRFTSSQRKFVYDQEMKRSDPLYKALKSQYYEIEHIEKPIKACTSYKSDDLYLMATKLNLNPFVKEESATAGATTTKPKMKKKQDMYDEIVATIRFAQGI